MEQQPLGPAPSTTVVPREPTERRWVPAFAVVAVIFAVVFGGYVTAATLSKPAGLPVTVGGVVRISPLSGWELARRFDDPPGIELTRGGGNLDVIAIGFAGDAASIVREFVTQVLEPGAERLSVSQRIQRIELRSGLSAVRIFYIGVFGRGQTPIEGEVTTVVSPSGVGVVFDGWAPAGLLDYVGGDIHEMIETAEVR
ncbi:MAG: hypothetical protein ACT4PO_01085 [Actinomycetota bacterium]